MSSSALVLRVSFFYSHSKKIRFDAAVQKAVVEKPLGEKIQQMVSKGNNHLLANHRSRGRVALLSVKREHLTGLFDVYSESLAFHQRVGLENESSIGCDLNGRAGRRNQRLLCAFEGQLATEPGVLV